MQFLPGKLLPGETLHFAPKVFDVILWNGIVKQFLNDWSEVSQRVNRGQGRGVRWSQESTQRTQQEGRLDHRQRESASFQVVRMETVPGTRQCGRFRELLIKTQDLVHVLFDIRIWGRHVFFLRAVASRWLSRTR